MKILTFPDPRLRLPAKPVAQVDDDIRSTIDEMFETMYAAGGIGLAATQVNIQKQIIVIDISVDSDDQLVFINPQLNILSDSTCAYREGCLSVPGFYAEVSRPEKIALTALDRAGKSFTIEPEPNELLSVCIQHEMDHLAGKLFVDYLSPVIRRRIGKKTGGSAMRPEQIRGMRDEQPAHYAKSRIDGQTNPL